MSKPQFRVVSSERGALVHSGCWGGWRGTVVLTAVSWWGCRAAGGCCCCAGWDCGCGRGWGALAVGRSGSGCGCSWAGRTGSEGNWEPPHQCCCHCYCHHHPGWCWWSALGEKRGKGDKVRGKHWLRYIHISSCIVIQAESSSSNLQQVCVLCWVSGSWFLERDRGVEFLRCLFLSICLCLFVHLLPSDCRGGADSQRYHER